MNHKENHEWVKENPMLYRYPMKVYILSMELLFVIEITYMNYI